MTYSECFLSEPVYTWELVSTFFIYRVTGFVSDTRIRHDSVNNQMIKTLIQGVSQRGKTKVEVIFYFMCPCENSGRLNSNYETSVNYITYITLIETTRHNIP